MLTFSANMFVLILFLTTELQQAPKQEVKAARTFGEIAKPATADKLLTTWRHRPPLQSFRRSETGAGKGVVDAPFRVSIDIAVIQ